MAPPMKVCLRPACRALISHELTYCTEHDQYINRKFNKYRKTFDKEYINFYKTKAWLNARKMALLRDDYICKICEEKGRFTSAQLVHHIVEVKEDWNLRLDIDNLQSLCESCHQKIHKGS